MNPKHATFQLEQLEERTNLSAILSNVPAFAVGSGGGTPSFVDTYTSTGQLLSVFNPFPGYNGPISVALGFVNPDVTEDLIVSAEVGSSHVKIFTAVTGPQLATPHELASFYAFPGFTGGVSVAAGDVNGDRFSDIIIGAGDGGQSRVNVFSGKDLSLLESFVAYPGFNGGVNVAAGDVGGDGHVNIITGTGDDFSHVKVFNGTTGAVLQSFIAFSGFNGGVTVASGNFGNPYDDVIVGAATGTSAVKDFDGQTNAVQRSFLAFPGFDGGVRVGVDNENILAIAYPGGPPHVEGFEATPVPLGLSLSFYAYDPASGTPAPITVIPPG